MIDPVTDGTAAPAVQDKIQAPRASLKATKTQQQTLVATGMGNALEWYDWGIYSAFAIYFATEVFIQRSPWPRFLGAMAVFAVGFIARPVGGFLFGWMADHLGRRAAMTPPSASPPSVR